MEDAEQAVLHGHWLEDNGALPAVVKAQVLAELQQGQAGILHPADAVGGVGKSAVLGVLGQDVQLVQEPEDPLPGIITQQPDALGALRVLGAGPVGAEAPVGAHIKGSALPVIAGDGNGFAAAAAVPEKADALLPDPVLHGFQAEVREHLREVHALRNGEKGLAAGGIQPGYLQVFVKAEGGVRLGGIQLPQGLGVL